MFGQLARGRPQLIVLGPGFGESILVYVPGSPPGWLVVDSLITDRGGDAPHPVLDALDALGAAPDLVLLTHAHADHAAGMDRVVERYAGTARFGVLDIDAHGVSSARVRAAAQRLEAAAALRAIRALHPERRWQLDDRPMPLGDGTVTILHPHDARLRHLAGLASVGPNRLSSAALVQWNERRILLGADLEKPEWRHLSAAGLDASDPVKVPHHGSAGALDDRWAGLPVSPRQARQLLIAPFDKHPKLPDVDARGGIDLLLERVEAVHISSLPFATVPSISGTTTLEALREARDRARDTPDARAGLPAVLGDVSAPQVDPAPEGSWLRAELDEGEGTAVTGGAAHIRVDQRSRRPGS